MIKAQYLRIGNKLMIHDLIITVESINFNPVDNKYYIECYENYNRYVLQYCKPIPLTEEILLKCEIEECGLILKYNSPRECYALYYLDTLLVFVYSLHQLQNLYFALTGEELKINF